MSPAAEQVLQAALALPDEERLEMIDALLAAASAGSARPVDEAWMAEIQRRSAEFDAGKVTPIPWEEVRRRGRREDRSGG